MVQFPIVMLYKERVLSMLLSGRVVTCAFSGRRPESLPWKYDETHPLCQAFIPALRQCILNAYREGYRVFMSGMALGIDMIACAAVLLMRDGEDGSTPLCPDVQLVGVVPGPGQESRWLPESQERYRCLLAQCDHVITLGADRILGTAQERHYSRGLKPSSYIARNRFMVDNASRLIAVWDGSPSGGTYHTIEYARKQGLYIDYLRL